MKTTPIRIDGIGPFQIPAEPEARRIDSEFTVRSVVGRIDPALAKANGEWGDRVGQEYSYFRHGAVEDVRTVLDIGANIGSFAVWAAKVWWLETIERVYCYEPNEELCEIIQMNAGLIGKGIAIAIVHAAVTIDPEPKYREHVQTGRSYTWGFREGQPLDGWAEPVPVPALHPRDLPPADAIKTDAEGVDLEIFEHYLHWSRIKVAMFEWHTHEHRVGMQRIVHDAGLRCAKDDCGESDQGVAVWVRR